MKPLVDVRILKIELVDIAREFACGDNALVYITYLEARIKALEANTSKSVLRRIDAQLDNG